MPYLTCGDPDFNSTVEIASAMLEAGAALMELGVPFSDPTADGPVIQRAMVRAMKNEEFSMNRIFQTAMEIHTKNPEVPLVFLTYFNTMLCFETDSGAEKSLVMYLKKAYESGIRGLVIPDLPFDSPEAEFIRKAAAETGTDICQVMMVTPNTSRKRLKSIAKSAAGFIYYVTSLGVTGQKGSLPKDLKAKIEQVKKATGVPVLAGFGITKPEEASAISGVVDGVIVGSLHHSMIEQGAGPAEFSSLTAGFVNALKKEKNL